MMFSPSLLKQFFEDHTLNRYQSVYIFVICIIADQFLMHFMEVNMFIALMHRPFPSMRDNNCI